MSRTASVLFASPLLLACPAFESDDTTALIVSDPVGENFGDLSELCGLTCPATGVIEGNASISGVASFDRFFRAVIDLRDSKDELASSVRNELLGMADILHVPVANYATESELSLATKIAIQLNAEVTKNLTGKLSFHTQIPACTSNPSFAIEAATECDADVSPADLAASCNGSCEVFSPSIAATCNEEGKLRCEGKAPDFVCTGPCTGSCVLEQSTLCEGSCTGGCIGTCTVCQGDECDCLDDDGQAIECAESNVAEVTNCAGQCSGQCTGSCFLAGGEDCDGRCEGECFYAPDINGCDSDATLICDFQGDPSPDCESSCDGIVVAPDVSPQCKASVDTKSAIHTTCLAPHIELALQLDSKLSADEQRTFNLRLQRFATRYRKLLSQRAKLEILEVAVATILQSTRGAIEASLLVQLESEQELSMAVGINCALDELGHVEKLLQETMRDFSMITVLFQTVLVVDQN